MSRTVDLRVASNGRLVLPKAMRDAMGLQGDAKVVATIDGDEVRLTPVHHGARRAQELYRTHVKSPRSVDDFLRERREEADREEGRATSDDVDARAS